MNCTESDIKCTIPDSHRGLDVSERTGQILIVDDDEDILTAGRLLLRRHFAAVTTCRDPQGALDAVLGTAAIFEAGGDPQRQAMALANEAAALEALGELSAAVDQYTLSARLLKEVNQPEMRAEVLQSLSALQLRLGKPLPALATMQASVGEVKKPGLRQRFLKRLLDIPFKLLERK